MQAIVSMCASVCSYVFVTVERFSRGAAIVRIQVMQCFCRILVYKCRWVRRHSCDRPNYLHAVILLDICRRTTTKSIELGFSLIQDE